MHRINKLYYTVIIAIFFIMIAAILFITLDMLITPFYYETLQFARGDLSKSSGRNLLEIAYFIANSTVALFTPILLIIAIYQFRQSEKTGMATVYMEVINRYNEKEMKYSRNKIISFKRRWPREKEENECISQFAHRLLLKDYEEHNSIFDQESEYVRTIKYLMFLEDIGVLIEQRYINENDLYNFLGTEIIATEEILCDHIKWMRDLSNSKSICANALNVMEGALKQKSRLVTYNKGVYRR